MVLSFSKCVLSLRSDNFALLVCNIFLHLSRLEAHQQDLAGGLGFKTSALGTSEVTQVSNDSEDLSHKMPLRSNWS